MIELKKESGEIITFPTNMDKVGEPFVANLELLNEKQTIKSNIELPNYTAREMSFHMPKYKNLTQPVDYFVEKFKITNETGEGFFRLDTFKIEVKKCQSVWLEFPEGFFGWTPFSEVKEGEAKIATDPIIVPFKSLKRSPVYINILYEKEPAEEGKVQIYTNEVADGNKMICLKFIYDDINAMLIEDEEITITELREVKQRFNRELTEEDFEPQVKKVSIIKKKNDENKNQ